MSQSEPVTQFAAADPHTSQTAAVDIENDLGQLDIGTNKSSEVEHETNIAFYDPCSGKTYNNPPKDMVEAARFSLSLILFSVLTYSLC